MRKAIILWIARALRVNVNSLVIIPVDDSIKWISGKDRLPLETDGVVKQYLICHYNYFIEVAKFEKGEWYHISDRLSEPDYKLSKEGQPDYWAVITEPEEL